MSGPRLSCAGTLLLASTLLAIACHGDSGPIIRVSLGTAAADQRNFVPASAFAEYVELPNDGDELRVILSSAESSCDQFRRQTDDELRVTLVFQYPRGMRPTVGTYAWAGHEAHGGLPQSPGIPYVRPHVRLGSRGLALPPGGTVDLTSVKLERHGAVGGTIRLEQSGGEGVGASSVFGSFLARICRTNPSKTP